MPRRSTVAKASPEQPQLTPYPEEFTCNSLRLNNLQAACQIKTS